MNDKNNLLILAIGNPARGDDGLGPQFIEELKKRNIESLHFEWVYQLEIEHSELLSKYTTVIIVDATREGHGPFQFLPITPSEDTYFSSHILLPANVLALTHFLYNARPKVYLMAIKGECFLLSENLSENAQAHLSKSVEFFMNTFFQIS